MKQTFFNLPAARQAEIRKVCLEEFISRGYDLASINRMVKKLGIAKGSFYNYTDSKAELYLYFLKEIFTETASLQDSGDTYTTRDLFDRSGELLARSMHLYRKKPLHFRLILQAELDTGATIYPEAHKLRRQLSPDKSALFENIDWALYRFPKEEVIAIFIWLTRGLRDDLKQCMNSGMDIDELEVLTRKRLQLYRTCLSGGIYKINIEQTRAGTETRG